jgi:hypothetical protein
MGNGPTRVFLAKEPQTDVTLYGCTEKHNLPDCKLDPLVKRVRHSIDLEFGPAYGRSAMNKYAGFVQRRTDRHHTEICSNPQKNGSGCNIPWDRYDPENTPRTIFEAKVGDTWKEFENVFVLPPRYYADNNHNPLPNPVKLTRDTCCRSEGQSELFNLLGVMTLFPFRLVVDPNTGKDRREMREPLPPVSFDQEISV